MAAGVQGHHVRHTAPPRRQHREHGHRRVNSLAVHQVIVAAKDQPVDVGGKVVVTPAWVCAAAAYGETFYGLAGRKGAGTVSGQYGQLDVAAPGDPLADLVGVVFSSAEVRQETGRYDQDAERPTCCETRPLIIHCRSLSAGMTEESAGAVSGGRDGQARCYGAGTRDSREIASASLAQTTPDPLGKYFPGVVPLRTQSIRTPHTSRDLCLREALRPAAADKISEGFALLRHMVLDLNRWIVQQEGAGINLGQPDAELGLLTAERPLPAASQSLCEASDLPEHGLAERHVGPSEIPDRTLDSRQPQVAAADDPEKFGREPLGLASGPAGPGETAHAEHPLVGIRRTECIEPAVERDRIVVEKGDHCSARPLQPGVARPGQPAALGVGQDHAIVQSGTALLQQRLIVVDHDNELIVGAHLLESHADAAAQGFPSIIGMGTNNYS